MSDNKQVVLDAARKLASESLRGIFTAKGLNIETGISLPTIYKYLEVLEAEREIVVANPERERGRYYRLPTEADRQRHALRDANAEAADRVLSDPDSVEVLNSLGLVGRGTKVLDFVTLESLLALLEAHVPAEALKTHAALVRKQLVANGYEVDENE